MFLNGLQNIGRKMRGENCKLLKGLQFMAVILTPTGSSVKNSA